MNMCGAQCNVHTIVYTPDTRESITRTVEL